MLGLLAAACVLVTLPGTAWASPPAQPALKTWGADGAVKSEVIIGNVLYFGGSFSSVISPDGTQTMQRRHLAAVDLTTGDLLPWSPGTNGSVETMATDGTQIFVGGSFTTLGGVSRNRLGAVDLAGTALPWTTGANDTVLALAVSGTQIFVGGRFTTLGGQSRSRLGAVTTAGALLPWSPSADDRVKALTLLSSGDVVAGGYFLNVNGASHARIVRLDATTGNTLPWSSSATTQVVSLVTGPDDSVYGGIGGPGGGKVRGWTDTGGAKWTVQMDGDANAVTYYGGQVIAGGHWIELNGGTTLSRLAAFDPDTGALDTSWAPTPNKQVWSLATDGTNLVVGGVFTRISKGSYRRVAVFR